MYTQTLEDSQYKSFLHSRRASQMAKPNRISLLLGLLALMSFLSFIEGRPHPNIDDDYYYYDDDDDLGTIIATHPSIDYDDLGTVGGTHPSIDVEDLGTVINTHIDDDVSMSICRKDFPKDFIFGTSVSAYQVEGAKQGNGRGLTTWDEFTHKFPGKVHNASDGDFATDFYHRYKEDIKLMKDLNTNGFRFSISWTRVLPYGRVSKGVNEDGVEFYNMLINELLANGIQPSVTLFHWESPLALEMEYNGFLNKRIVDDFRDFSRFCFKKFGDRVKNWATFNEPSVYSVAGYSKGKKAPGRCSKYEGKCVSGDSSVEPYIVGHNQILAHAAAVDEFRKCPKCQEGGGKIGIVLVSHWFEPKNANSKEDQIAASRSLDFKLGWFLNPLTYGDYPEIMKKTLGKRLPKFTPEESQRLRDKALDFVGLNYYGAFYATHNQKLNFLTSYATDIRANWTTEQDGGLPRRKVTSMGIVIHPEGLRKLLKHMKDKYQDPEIYIMENGLDEIDEGNKSIADALRDEGRKEFIRSHILIMGKSIRMDGVKLKGYFIWSLMDNFEWERGYRIRFGLYYVNYKDNMRRQMRDSGKWLRKFLTTEESVTKCFFETHRQQRRVPRLFPVELYDWDDKRLSYVSDMM